MTCNHDLLHTRGGQYGCPCCLRLGVSVAGGLCKDCVPTFAPAFNHKHFLDSMSATTAADVLLSVGGVDHLTDCVDSFCRAEVLRAIEVLDA